MALTFWCLVLVARVALMTRAYQRIADENRGHRMPVVYGEFAVKPSRDVKRKRFVAALVVLVGAVQAANVVHSWGHWGLATYGVVATLFVVFTVPAAVVTVLHNRGNDAVSVTN